MSEDDENEGDRKRKRRRKTKALIIKNAAHAVVTTSAACVSLFEAILGHLGTNPFDGRKKFRATYHDERYILRV